jgi:DNA-binding protein HU-beta
MMTKPEIVQLISERAGISKKEATQALEAFVGTIHNSLKARNGRIRISELGTFRVVEMNARRGVNPQTLKEMRIPPMRLPRFSPAKALKRVVAKTK